jgi:hypothetical protein
MMLYAMKIVVSVAVMVGVTELSKRSTFLGSLLASLPLVSLLAMLWLFAETRDAGKVAKLSYSIFWLVLPSLTFFLFLPLLLKVKLNFYLSIVLAIAGMLACYGLMLFLLKKVGVEL